MKLPKTENTLSLRATFNPEISNYTGANPASIGSNSLVNQTN